MADFTECLVILAEFLTLPMFYLLKMPLEDFVVLCFLSGYIHGCLLFFFHILHICWGKNKNIYQPVPLRCQPVGIATGINQDQAGRPLATDEQPHNDDWQNVSRASMLHTVLNV